MPLRLLDDPAGWDRFVGDADGAAFTHLWGWREIMTDVLGHEWVPLAAVEGDERVVGVLPLVRLRSRLFGVRMVSLPFLNYGGPLGAPEVRRQLVDAAVADARRCGAGGLELRNRHPLECGLPAGRRKVTVLLELPPDPEVLWRDVFRSKLRSQIRRARKAGLEVRAGPDQVHPFYEVFARNMRDLGTPVLPREFFERVLDGFGGRVEFLTVWSRDQPIAGGCGFVWRDEFEITWASSLREHSSDAPNMLLYWSLMERMSRRGVRTFNFGRCTPGAGTHRFKRQWGGADEPLHWRHWSPATAPAPTYDTAGMRAASAVWQRLPLPVTRRLGPILARQLP